MKISVFFLGVFFAIILPAGHAPAGDKWHHQEIERQTWDQQHEVYDPQTGQYVPIWGYHDQCVRTIDGNPINPDERIACSDGRIYGLVPIEELDRQQEIVQVADSPVSYQSHILTPLPEAEAEIQHQQPVLSAKGGLVPDQNKGSGYFIKVCNP